MRKKATVFLALIMCALIVGCSDNDLDKNIEEAFKGYVQYIKEFVDDSEFDISNQVRYTLAFIDDDDIPELVISTGQAHASGIKICFYDNDNKRVVDTGENFCQNGDFESYYERKSCIYDYYFGNGGYFSVRFCRIGNAPDYKVTQSRYFTEWSDSEWNSHYAIDFEEVSKEEYYKAYTEDAPEFVKQDTITIKREDMQGDYQDCCSEDAMELFFQMLQEMKIKDNGM